MTIYCTTAEVARKSGASLRQLQWWDEKRVMCPMLERHIRVYSRAEAVQASVVVELRDRKIPLQRIRSLPLPAILRTPRRFLLIGARKGHKMLHLADVVAYCAATKVAFHVVDLRVHFERFPEE